MRLFATVLSVFAILTAASAASAQTVVYQTYSPVVAAAPMVVETMRPVVTNYRYLPPVSTSGFTAYTANYGNYAAAVTAYSPVVAAPVVTETVTAYSPVVTTYRPVVTTAYAPIVTTYLTPVVIRPRYVPGQPVRNFFRAVAR